jgi:hypothetical protein
MRISRRAGSALCEAPGPSRRAVPTVPAGTAILENGGRHIPAYTSSRSAAVQCRCRFGRPFSFVSRLKPIRDYPRYPQSKSYDHGLVRFRRSERCLRQAEPVDNCTPRSACAWRDPQKPHSMFRYEIPSDPAAASAWLARFRSRTRRYCDVDGLHSLFGAKHLATRSTSAPRHNEPNSKMNKGALTCD